MDLKSLQELADISGVEGVLLSTNSGRIIASSKIEMTPIKKRQIALHILRILYTHQLRRQLVREIELIWDNYRVMAMGTENFLIIIFCVSTKALSLVRITLNVVIDNLLEDKKFMKEIKKHKGNMSSVLRSDDLTEVEINLISKLQ